MLSPPRLTRAAKPWPPHPNRRARPAPDGDATGWAKDTIRDLMEMIDDLRAVPVTADTDGPQTLRARAG